MKSRMLLLFIVLLCVATLSAQTKMIESFDVPADSISVSNYNSGKWTMESAESANPDSNYQKLTWVEDPVYQGEKALRVEYRIQDSESWGGYSKFMISKEDSSDVFDFSGYDTLSFMYYIEEQISSGSLSFRLNLADCADSEQGNQPATNASCEYYYSLNDNILNESTPTGQWIEQKIAIESNASWDGSGFNLTGWAGTPGNQKIDKDKIKAIDFEFSIADGVPVTKHGVILIDDLKLTSPSKVPYVLFSGKNVSNRLTPFTWGQSSLEFEEGTGIEGSNAIKWTMGDEWANGWSGAGYNINPALNMLISWAEDSLKFGMKVSEGTDTLKFQFEDGTGKKAHLLDPIDDGEWHDYALKLSDFVLEEGDFFDSTAVTVIQFMANGNAVAGNTVLFDYIWTGNPEIDVVAPAAPTGVDGIPYPEQFYNMVMWVDVDGESGETYDVYSSPEPFTSLEDPSVVLINQNVGEGVQAVVDYLQYPLVSGPIDRYYAVVCKDAFGNASEPTFSSIVNGTGKGIPTISLDVPENFEADGYLDEWFDSGIKPWVLKPETDNVPAGTITDSTDLKATIWVAIDDDFLYVAGDIIDDQYVFADGAWWQNDACEFFIGLYNQTGAPHTANMRGNEPDYKLQFKEPGMENEYKGYTVENGSEFFYLEGFDPDYVFEAKVSLDSMAGSEDWRFHPKRGMKIPLEIYMHDRDDNLFEGGLGWSPKNEDNAWQSPSVWSYTWIGDTTAVEAGVTSVKDENVASKFSLDQNYPNPFNPTTTINYSLGKVEVVKISVYNMLGQQVAQLVNKQQKAGVHKVQWNAANVSTGVYFYQIQAGEFTQTKKMLLMK